MKRTHVPVPGSKPKPKPRDASEKAQLSQEFIGSDDDDVGSPAEKAPKPKPKPKPTPKTTMAVHKPNGSVKSKEESSAKQSAKSKSPATATAKPAPRKPAPKQVVTQEQAAELSSSEVTDNDDDNVPTRDMQTKLPGNKGRASESDSGSESDSSSDASDMDEASQPASRPVQAQARPPQAQPHAVDFRPAQAYVPPKGFSAVPCNDKTTAKSAHIFENLQGKQIWHITAPVGVSLKHLSEIAMDSAIKGEPVLQHNGTSYGLSKPEQGEDGACEVMVARKNGYKAVGTPITQSFRLQAAVQLPHLSSKQADPNTGSEAAASITRSTIRTPRPQLKGLKMRFLPTGFGAGDAGTLGDSDSEGETRRTTAGLGMPNELNLPSRKEKRKHTELNGDASIDPPSKKHKKHRTAEAKKANKEKKRAKS